MNVWFSLIADDNKIWIEVNIDISHVLSLLIMFFRNAGLGHWRYVNKKKGRRSSDSHGCQAYYLHVEKGP